MDESDTIILTKLNMFQDFLGIAPTVTQSAAAAATAVCACVSMNTPDDAEADTLLCALVLWWASIVGSKRITVLVGSDERARELLQRIHAMQYAVPANWRRPFSSAKSRWGQWYMGSFTGAGWVYMLTEPDDTLDWSAAVVVDRTFRRDERTCALLADHHRRGGTLTQYLFLSDTKQCHSSLSDLWITEFFPEVCSFTASTSDDGVPPLDDADVL